MEKCRQTSVKIFLFHFPNSKILYLDSGDDHFLVQAYNLLFLFLRDLSDLIDHGLDLSLAILISGKYLSMRSATIFLKEIQLSWTDLLVHEGRNVLYRKTSSSKFI